MAHILIVDDNPENIKVVGSILGRHKMDISFALDGETALKMLPQSSFDLILLDIVLPGMDGFSVCEQIKAMPNFYEIPIIFLTARTEIDSLSKGFEIGGVDYVTKPFHEKELVARVKTHIELNESKQNLEQALKHLRKDLLMARNIQSSSIFNPNLRSISGLAFHTEYLPKIEVGGDFFDIEEIEPNCVRIFLADATGHGVQAALVTMAIKAKYENMKDEFWGQPDELLRKLNQKYVQKYSMLYSFFTCFLLDIDLNQNQIVYTAAGHPPQVLLQKNRDMVSLGVEGAIIGMDMNSVYVAKTAEFAIGDRLVLFSDGLTEVFDDKGQQFGDVGMLPILQEEAGKKLPDLSKALLEAKDTFRKDHTILDDVTVIFVERL
ncbi:MAG: fused response regulator/phosphatase [Spirochaetota bacterium]